MGIGKVYKKKIASFNGIGYSVDFMDSLARKNICYFYKFMGMKLFNIIFGGTFK